MPKSLEKIFLLKDHYDDHYEHEKSTQKGSKLIDRKLIYFINTNRQFLPTLFFEVSTSFVWK